MQTLLDSPSSTTVRPSNRRRTAVGVTGFLACALPTVFTINLSRMLLVGELSPHRFHQLTGQGLLLCLLWLACVVPLVRAGWAGRRPTTATGLMHVTFAVTGSLCSIAAPGGGAPILMAVIVVTGALLWLALPLRPRLRTELRVDPLLAPLALLGAALSTPYALDQIGLQNDATGHHAINPHFFDMAWTALTLVVLVALAAMLPVVRRLALWGSGGMVWTGAIGVALGEDRPWTALALGLGAATAAATVATSRWSKSRVGRDQVI